MLEHRSFLFSYHCPGSLVSVNISVEWSYYFLKKNRQKESVRTANWQRTKCRPDWNWHHLFYYRCSTLSAMPSFPTLWPSRTCSCKALYFSLFSRSSSASTHNRQFFYASGSLVEHLIATLPLHFPHYLTFKEYITLPNPILSPLTWPLIFRIYIPSRIVPSWRPIFPFIQYAGFLPLLEPNFFFLYTTLYLRPFFLLFYFFLL